VPELDELDEASAPEELDPLVVEDDPPEPPAPPVLLAEPPVPLELLDDPPVAPLLDVLDDVPVLAVPPSPQPAIQPASTVAPATPAPQTKRSARPRAMKNSIPGA
jgi:hypothetical protein